MKSTTLLIVLLLLVLVGATANVLVTLKSRSSQSCSAALPCAAIPTRFVMEHPDCADKLLRSMNVTKVRIQTDAQAKTSEARDDRVTI